MPRPLDLTSSVEDGAVLDYQLPVFGLGRRLSLGIQEYSCRRPMGRGLVLAVFAMFGSLCCV